MAATEPKKEEKKNAPKEGRKGSVIMTSTEVDQIIGELKDSEEVNPISLLKMLGSGNEVAVQAAVRYIEHKDSSAMSAGKKNYQPPFDETTYLAAETAVDNIAHTYRPGSAGRANYEQMSVDMRESRYRAKNAKKRDWQKEAD